MTTRMRRADRYRVHELAFDRSNDGTAWSCACGSPSTSTRFLDESDAHYFGAAHLARMAYRRLALRGLVPMEVSSIEMWAALAEHREQLGDEAQAVLDTAVENWPDRTTYRGGVGVDRA